MYIVSGNGKGSLRRVLEAIGKPLRDSDLPSDRELRNEGFDSFTCGVTGLTSYSGTSGPWSASLDLTTAEASTLESQGVTIQKV